MVNSWKSYFAICDEFWSYNLTCTGSDCYLLNEFPNSTCTTQGDTLSCNNGIVCGNEPEYVFMTEWSEDENEQRSIHKKAMSKDCGFSLVSSSSGMNSSVVLANDTCTGISPFNTTILPLDNMAYTISSSTQSITWLLSEMTIHSAPSSADDTTWLSTGTTPHLASTSSDNTVGSSSETSLSSLAEDPIKLLTATTTSVPKSFNNTAGFSFNTPPASTPTSTLSSSVSQFTGAGTRVNISFLKVLCFLLVTVSFLCTGVSASAIGEESKDCLDIEAKSIEVLRSGSIQERAEVPPVDWTKLARRSDIDIMKLLEFIQKISSRKTADGISSGVWWIEREDWVEEIFVNVQDIVCKEFTAAGLGPAQKKLYKDRLFKEFQESMTKQIMKKFTTPSHVAKELITGKKSVASLVASVFANFGVEVMTGWMHKQLPVVGSATSIICPKVCNDENELRLTDPLNCGVCGHSCASGNCENGVCTEPSCLFAGESGAFSTCGVGPNADTCTCASTFWGTGFCVQYSSSLLDLTGDTCEFSYDCPKGQVCVTLPTGIRRVCADAQSCMTQQAPEEVELVPEFAKPKPSTSPWILHIRTPLDQGSELAYDENPAKIYTLNHGNLVENENGKITQNTQCINVIDTASQQIGLPAFLGGLGGSFPEGWSLYFGYDAEEDLNADNGDTCCLRLYEEDNCAGNRMQKREECGQWVDDLRINVRSWRVDSCGGLFTA
ncbi:hypothetical protein CC78DRAFT_583248 [Lojkania enalia]|uniref:Uncharacterized protein n=1 Tax=Lojkania enalia TaxID=147567 RepID=A0A9P4N7F0_9PLEO|nr:hypothetical protein CC78DRAFT_583248 [Didymosphaeria enalia]